MTRILILVVALVALAGGNALAGADASAAFEALKKLEGTWEGEGGMGDQRFPGTHEIRVSAAGTVVMETMNPGTDHEMINMYHMDGGDLVLTHYCAGGNQPTMKLNAENSSATELHFDFTGGTNLDPSKDQHIHAAVLTLGEDGTFGETWFAWSDGKAAPVPMKVELARVE